MAQVLFSPTDMTSDALPAPFVVSGQTIYTTFLASLAFNGVASGGSYSLITGSAGWWKIDIGSGNSKILSTYSIQVNAVPEPNRAPKDWTMEGSNDNATWNTIDTVTAQTTWTSQQIRTFTCDTQVTAYRYFRLNVTANNGDAGYTQAAELRFYYDDAPPPSGIIVSVMLSQYRRRW